MENNPKAVPQGKAPKCWQRPQWTHGETASAKLRTSCRWSQVTPSAFETPRVMMVILKAQRPFQSELSKITVRKGMCLVPIFNKLGTTLTPTYTISLASELK
jgi:hypothetical protein